MQWVRAPKAPQPTLVPESRTEANAGKSDANDAQTATVSGETSESGTGGQPGPTRSTTPAPDSTTAKVYVRINYGRWSG